MSRQKPGLSSPPVVVGVFVVLAVLVVVNIRTFAPRQARGPRADAGPVVRPRTCLLYTSDAADE